MKRFDPTAPPAPSSDPVVALLALHDLSVGLRGIIEKHAPDVLRMILGGMITMQSEKKKSLVAKMRDTMPPAEFEAIVAEYRRP